MKFYSEWGNSWPIDKVNNATVLNAVKCLLVENAREFLPKGTIVNIRASKDNGKWKSTDPYQICWYFLDNDSWKNDHANVGVLKNPIEFETFYDWGNIQI